MSGVRIEGADAAKIAQQLGQKGTPMPDWVRGNPSYVAAYDQGTGDGERGAQFHPPAQPRTPRARKSKNPAGGAATPPSAPPGGQASKPGYFDRAFSPTAAANKSGLSAGVGRLSSAGDGGGLLLALVVYPIVLATIEYGASGPGMWFRAKFLNQVPENVSGQSTDPSAPYYVNPKAKPGQPGSGKWPNGDPIPGYPQPPAPGTGTA